MRCPLRPVCCLLAAGALVGADCLVLNPARSGERLDLETVAALWSGRRTTWGDGGRVVLTIATEGAAASRALPQVTGKTPAQNRMSWRRAVFTGQGRAPRECRDDAEVLAAVARDRDAIGIVAEGTAADGVVVVPLP